VLVEGLLTVERPVALVTLKDLSWRIEVLLQRSSFIVVFVIKSIVIIVFIAVLIIESVASIIFVICSRNSLI
jgi:hypothetical protein